MDVAHLQAALAEGPLARWAGMLPDQVARGLDPRRHGDLPRWEAALASLPAVRPSAVDLSADTLRIGWPADLTPEQHRTLEKGLRALHPWRKGPYELFGLTIDTEWRSDWKWQRLADHLAPLDGRLVLDVGCGNGYHAWRMRGAGAARVIGIDPSPLFVMQFQAVKRYLRTEPVDVLPLGIDDLPPKLEAFDTVFSMGVLYHRRSPLDHLLQLKDALRPGGELVLETLIVAGDANTVLVPEGRYGKMGNVWFIPSVPLLERWLRRCGFRDVRVVDVTPTTTAEQRSTEWMTFQSLADFLDPSDSSRTVEGYPAPVRAVVLANRP